jgi:hypothetical protein
MKLQRPLLFTALLTVIAAGASAQVTLRLKLQPKTYQYAMTMDVDQGPIGKMKSRSTMVIAVKKKGANYLMTMSTKDIKVTAPKGSPMEAQAKQLEQASKGEKTTATYSDRGVLVGALKVTGNKAAQNMFNGMQIGFMGVEFPVGPVRVGSSWTAQMDLAKIIKSMGAGQMPPGMKVSGKPLVIKYTVRSLGSQHGKRLVNVGYTLTGLMNMSMSNQGRTTNMSMKIGGTGTSVVDVATGLQTKSTGTMSMSMSPMNMTMKMVASYTLK